MMIPKLLEINVLKLKENWEGTRKFEYIWHLTGDLLSDHQIFVLILG